MTGAELYAHLRDDGPWAALKAVLVLVGAVAAISTLVHWWHTRRNRRTPAPEAARIRAALRREGYRMYGPDDQEWAQFTRSHRLRLRRPDRVDRLVDDALYGDHGDRP